MRLSLWHRKWIINIIFILLLSVAFVIVDITYFDNVFPPVLYRMFLDNLFAVARLVVCFLLVEACIIH